MRDRVIEQVPEVWPDGRLAPADVHVEHLHPVELVDQRLALRGAQLTGIPPPGRRQTVHARQVARVRQLPREADWCHQTALKLLNKARGCHRSPCSRIMAEPASVASARSYAGSACADTPADSHADLALGCSASDRTTVTTVGSFRNDSRRVP